MLIEGVLPPDILRMKDAFSMKPGEPVVECTCLACGKSFSLNAYHDCQVS